MQITTRIYALTLLAFVLSSCGFALRGATTGPIASDTVFVQSAQANSELTQALSAALTDAQLRLLDSAQGAHYVLQIGAEQFNSRTSTVNGRARAAQYTLQLSTEVSLSQQGNEIVNEETLSVERSYFEDTANIAGSTQEVAILQEEMRRELVEQVMRRLRAAAQGN